LSAITVLGGTGGGQVTIPGVISGAGGLVKTSPGMLVIYGLNANTYSGGTVINGGTLHWGTITNGISPACNFALGTGPVTLGNGATLEFDRVTATNALISNGGKIASVNGWGVTWNGPVTLNATTTLDSTDGNAGLMTFGGAISGAGGLIKAGNKTMNLSGTNSYTGGSYVTAGTLACSKAVALGSGPLSISDGATVNLNYNGTRTIEALTLGGVSQPPGTYGSSSSPAATKDAHFTGNGTVTVAPLAGSLTNTPATGITTTTAALNATLACNGSNYTVYAYWNTVNGGTNAATWANSAYVGAWTNVVSTNLSRAVTGLAPNTTYYFTFRAANTAYTVWATNVLSFTTLPLPPTPVLPGSAITLSGGVPNFTFATAAGFKYRLVCKDTLTNVSWLPVIATPSFPLPDGWSATATGAPMSLSDTNSAGQPQRFYRLEAANP
jgi:autotransporter-associated beta strand protein